MQQAQLEADGRQDRVSNTIRRSSPRAFGVRSPAPLRSLISDGPGCGPTTGGSPSGARTPAAAQASPRRLNDVEASVKEIHWAAEHGLKGTSSWHPPDADVPKLWSDEYDPTWRACEEIGLSVNQHGGAGVPTYTAKIKNFLMIMEVPFFANRSLWHVILSAAERFEPAFVMTEQRTGWVPETLKKMDGVWWAFNNGDGIAQMATRSNVHRRATSTRTAPWVRAFRRETRPRPSRSSAWERDVGLGLSASRGDLPDSVARCVMSSRLGVGLHEFFGKRAKLYGLDIEPMAALELGPTVDEIATPLDEIPDNPPMAFGRRL